jgi:hypothetical protein
MSSGYQKFSSRFVSDGGKPKTFASFATFADGGRNFEGEADAEKAKVGTPKIQSASVKVAQVAKVGAPEAVCAVCNAAGELWHFGDVRIHQECAPFLPKSEPAEPTAAYHATSADPATGRCSVTMIELPRAQRYRKTFAALQLKPPALIDVARWHECIEDGKRFLAKWGEQAQALGWTSADLFGLHAPPEQPHPSYRRLSRYHCTGLVWLLRDRQVVALTEATAAIENPETGSITVYRKHNKPALGPLGDSLDDLGACLAPAPAP